MLTNTLDISGGYGVSTLGKTPDFNNNGLQFYASMSFPHILRATYQSGKYGYELPSPEMKSFGRAARDCDLVHYKQSLSDVSDTT